MYIGVARLELSFPEATDLKGKRRVLRSIKDRLRDKFNVSVAEVGGLDYHQRGTIGIVVASNDGRFCDSVIQEAIGLVESVRDALVLDVATEVTTVLQA